jgi:hypothetical protein
MSEICRRYRIKDIKRAPHPTFLAAILHRHQTKKCHQQLKAVIVMGFEQ